MSVDPIFTVGPVPSVPWCEIQNLSETADGNWLYFIWNKYNPWASGWMDENDVISEISKRKAELSTDGGEGGYDLF